MRGENGGGGGGEEVREGDPFGVTSHNITYV